MTDNRNGEMRMIFDNIEFHNVAELEPGEEGYSMWRVPGEVREKLNESARNNTSCYGTGVELRFKIKGDFATLILNAEESAEAAVAYIYYGSIQGGWENSSRVIGSRNTRIRIDKPQNTELLMQMEEACRLPFKPDVVRVVLPYLKVRYVGIEGEVEPPEKEDLPGKTYLAYGSSITHGSLALAAPYTYPFRLSQKLRCDYINFGFAGSAHMERAMAEYIVSRQDWDFATVEMGVNMLEMDAEVFEKRIDEFTEVFSREKRPVYATSIYGFNLPALQKSGRLFREIVEKYAKGRLRFVDGREILNDPAFISQDMIHPSIEGTEQIVNRWYAILTSQQEVRG